MKIALATSVRAVTSNGTKVKAIGGGFASCKEKAANAVLATSVKTVTSNGTKVKAVGGGNVKVKAIGGGT